MKLKPYYILATAALLWVGCTNEGRESAEELREITFYPTVDNALPGDLNTRAVAADLEVTGILLNGFYSTAKVINKTGFAAAGAKTVFSQLRVAYDGTYAGNRYFWASSPSFYHFWGYNDIGTLIEDGEKCGIIANDPAVNGGTITFVQCNNPGKMYDLVLAKPVWDKQPLVGIIPDVELSFQHVLSKVNFRVYNPNMTQLNNCKLSLTFTSDVFKRRATFELNGDRGAPVLDDALFHSGTHLIAPPFDVPSTATTVDKACFAGDMILLPQPMPYGSITLELTYTVDGTVEEKKVEAPMPSGTFVAGMSYTYSLLLDAKVASMKIISMQLVPWDIVYSTEIPIFDY